MNRADRKVRLGSKARRAKPEWRARLRQRAAGADPPREGENPSRGGEPVAERDASKSVRKSKRQAGNDNPGEVAWKQAAASGEGKAVSRLQLHR